MTYKHRQSEDWLFLYARYWVILKWKGEDEMRSLTAFVLVAALRIISVYDNIQIRRGPGPGPEPGHAWGSHQPRNDHNDFCIFFSIVLL